MVRPDGLEVLLLEVLEEAGEDGAGELLLEVREVVVPGSSPEVPQAVRVRATASPTKHVVGGRGVIFVTNPSLDSAI